MKLGNKAKYLSFSIAVGLNVYSVVEVFLTPVFVNANGDVVSTVVADTVMYAGIGLLITGILIVAKKTLWKHFFTLLLLLSFGVFIQFCSTTFAFGLGALQIELISLVLLILHISMNPDILSDMRNYLGVNRVKISTEKLSVKRHEDRLEKFEAEVQSFQTKFATKAIIDLEEIVSENKHAPEAIEAAKRLLARNDA